MEYNNKRAMAYRPEATRAMKSRYVLLSAAFK